MNAGLQQPQQQIQQQAVPEWLSTLVDALPVASRMKNTRPPPHIIEMALAALKNSKLPAKPASSTVLPMSGISKESDAGKEMIIATQKRKRSVDNGDLSDDEGDMAAGHGSLFRIRQQARQTGSP